MKKVLFLLAVTLACYTSTAQEVKLRGKVVSISKKQFTDSTSITLSVDYPLHTTLSLSDSRLILDNMVTPVRYRLSDKEVTRIRGEWVISYMAEIGNDLKLVAASEINGCPNYIKVAIFSFTGSPRYIEYLVKVAKILK